MNIILVIIIINTYKHILKGINLLNDNNKNQDFSIWNVSNVINMIGIFCNAREFNQNINNWNVSNITCIEGMLYESDFGDV